MVTYKPMILGSIKSGMVLSNTHVYSMYGWGRGWTLWICSVQ